MKNITFMTPRTLKIVLSCIISYFTIQSSNAGNIRQISSMEGISNNSVLCLSQDRDGFIWIGTCEGLNIWDGQEMVCYPQTGSQMKALSGNLIEKIQPTQDGYYWLRTNYGLDLMDSDKVIEQHKEFQGIYHLLSRNKNETIVITSSGKTYGYCENSSSFKEVSLKLPEKFDDFINCWTGNGDSIYLFLSDGIYKTRFKRGKRADMPCSIETPELLFRLEIQYSFPDKSSFIPVIDNKGILYLFNTANEVLEYIDDISPDIKQYGKVSYAIKTGNDFLISYLFDGVTKLSYTPGSPEKYSKSRLPINCGVFYLLKDSRQDIVWIGSDGQGVFMYANHEKTFRSYSYDKLPLRISKPIRNLLLDSRGDLWIATKGEGLIVVPGGIHSGGIDNMKRITASDSELSDNAVFALEESRRGLIYIGSEGAGIDYLSFSDNKIHNLGGNLPPDLKYIHSIYESDKNIIWVATVGCGVFKLTIDEKNGAPYISEWSKLDFGEKFKDKNFFFTLYADIDKTIWIGNRGGGLIHYFPDTGVSVNTTFEKGRAEIANDVWAIHRSENGILWIGTSWGLLYIDSSGEIHETEIRNLVHGILEDKDGMLFITTNNGLIGYDTKTGRHTKYGYSYGVNIMEYSDGAAYYDKNQDIMFLGGTTGFVTVESDNYNAAPFYPDLHIKSVQINDKVVPINDALKKGVLKIKPGEQLFAIKAIVLDYVNSSNYIYEYSTDRHNKVWTESSSEIKFNEKRPGKYTLGIKYRNVITGESSPVKTLNIRIKSPWYLSFLAKSLYALSILSTIAITGLYYHRRRKQKKQRLMEKIEISRREESLLQNAHLMENIAQQMAIPVSMISVPGQQILEYQNSDSLIKDYSARILKECSKLEHMIHMLHDFRESSETNTSSSSDTKIFPVSEYLGEVAGSYRTLAEERNIDLEIKTPENIMYASDPKKISAILDMTMTNAFLHVKKKGKIFTSIQTSEDYMTISIEVEGTWLSEEEFRKITDRYDMMEEFQKKGESGESFQDGIRLVISYNYAVSLGGSMEYSEGDNIFAFKIKLPAGKAEYGGKEIISDGKFDIELLQHSHINMIEKEGIKQFSTELDLQTMFIIGTDTGIINAIAEMFSNEFNIKTFSKTKLFQEEMESGHPDIIIGENIHMRDDVKKLLKSIKQDKLTVKIPVVFITSLQDAESSDIDYSDVTLPLPINAKTLKRTVKNSLKRVTTLREYYKSAISTYEFSEGKMLHSEDKQFLEKMFGIINENITDSSLTTGTIAKEMGMSIRNLYHRLEKIINITPSNIIREYRLTYAQQLLTTTRLSVDEIIYKSGFSNRGTFFKNFSAKFGCTPKAYRENNKKGLE